MPEVRKTITLDEADIRRAIANFMEGFLSSAVDEDKIEIRSVSGTMVDLEAEYKC